MPLQMRLDFSPVADEVAVSLTLSGWTVLCEVPDGFDKQWWKMLAECGCDPQIDDVRGVSFPLVDLHNLEALPSTVRLQADVTLAPLLELLLDPPPVTSPATLRTEHGQLELAWRSVTQKVHRFELEPPVAAKLPSLNLPFLASAPAWGALAEVKASTGTIAAARVNLDGFIELATAVPQLLEAAPIPGLFRLDATHYGVAVHYSSVLDEVPGVVWSGPRPALEEVPAVSRLGIELSPHVATDARRLLEVLQESSSAVLAWDTGLGRRICALAALDALDAFPALVVCPASSLWVWQRHLDLVKRTSSVTHDRAEVRLVTVEAIERGEPLPSMSAVVLDGLDTAEFNTAAARSALHRLDGLAGVYRIGLAATWPESIDEQVALVELVRPAEFRTPVLLSERYPLNPSRRAEEHLAAYVLARTAPTGGTKFRSSTVRCVPQSSSQERFVQEVARRNSGDLAGMLAELLEVTTSGPATALGPKVPTAVALLKEAVAANQRTVLVTRSRRFASLVSSMLLPLSVPVVDPGDPLSGELVQVALFTGALPDLRGFDSVVVADYPWSSSLLDTAVGTPSSPGPQSVTILHVSGSVEDRLAQLAARRREVATVCDPSTPPNGQDLIELLGPLLASVDLPGPSRECRGCGAPLAVSDASVWCSECGGSSGTTAPLLLRLPHRFRRT